MPELSRAHRRRSTDAQRSMKTAFVSSFNSVGMHFEFRTQNSKFYALPAILLPVLLDSTAQQRLDKLKTRERAEVFDAFTSPDKANGQAKLLDDREGNATSGSTV